jgi:hypothetical protein
LGLVIGLNLIEMGWVVKPDPLFLDLAVEMIQYLKKKKLKIF